MATRTREEASAPLLAALRGVAYFRSVPAAELAQIARRCRVLALRKGERAFEVGEPCTGLFVIASGAIELRQTSPRGREQVLHAEGPGATLGEAPLFDGKGFIATAVAVSPTRLGTVRELVSRALAELERRGLIERRRSKIVLRDAERLAALAQGESGDVT